MASTTASSKRTRRIFEAGFSAIVSKGLILVVNAVSIPITVRYLGPAEFGVWVTISTTLSLLMVLDLGIANALTNLISEAYAKDNKMLAAQYSASAFWVMILIAAALGVIGALINPHISWGSVLHLSHAADIQSATRALAIAYGIFLFGLPAGLGAKILGGYQELRTTNIVSVIASIASLGAILIGTRLHGGLAMLVGLPAAAALCVNIGCLVWLWTSHKPWLTPTVRHWNSQIVRRLMVGGSELFILQLAGLIVFNSDNFVILHYLGPADVTPYSITWKLVGYAGVLQVIITPALWPAYAEAYVRGDLGWIRRTARTVMLSTMGVAIASCVILIVWGKQLIQLWAGAAAIPSERLIVAMCVWILISTYMSNTSTVLLATNATKLIAWLSAVAAVVNLELSIWLVQRIGSLGVILGTIISYLVVLVGPQTFQIVRVLRFSNVSERSLRAGV